MIKLDLGASFATTTKLNLENDQRLSLHNVHHGHYSCPTNVQILGFWILVEHEASVSNSCYSRNSLALYSFRRYTR